MSGRLAGKVAIVVGAGQTPGDTIGNGRATAVLFAREGARVVAVDRRLESAEETVAMIRAEGGEADALAGRRDARGRLRRAGRRRACSATAASTCCTTTSASAAATPGPPHVTEEAWDRILAVNLKSVMFPCKHALPVMREQQGGAITNVSSIAAVCATPAGRLQDLEGRHQRLHAVARDRQREVRHPRERDHARPDGDADGDRGHLARARRRRRRS